MGVDCTIYAGYKIDFSEAVDDQDFLDLVNDKINEFKFSKVELIIDGMCGQYAYLFYKEGELDAFYGTSDQIILDENKDEAYEQLSKIYFAIMNKDLKENKVKHVVIAHYS